MQPATSDDGRTMTLEAFADTIIPGERRTEHDRAVAGAAEGGGAVAAGAVELLRLPAVGLAEVLDSLIDSLDEHARQFAGRRGLDLDASVPPFVALSFAERTELVLELTAPAHPEREVWIGIALFANMAYDSAAHLPTVAAMEAGHPGLLSMGFATPDPDGLWRFPRYSYGRALARLHPATTVTGSPA